MRSSAIAAFVAIVAIVLGAGLYYYSKNTRKAEENKNSEISESQSSSDSNQNKKEIEEEGSAAEPLKILLKNVSETEANGVANRVYSSGEFIHTVVATLPNRSEEYFYQGWLVKGELDQNQIISTGKLKKDGNEYYLEYRSNKDLSSYNRVVVGLKKEDNDQVEGIILEGDFDDQ